MHMENNKPVTHATARLYTRTTTGGIFYFKPAAQVRAERAARQAAADKEQN